MSRNFRRGAGFQGYFLDSGCPKGRKPRRGGRGLSWVGRCAGWRWRLGQRGGRGWVRQGGAWVRVVVRGAGPARGDGRSRPPRAPWAVCRVLARGDGGVHTGTVAGSAPVGARVARVPVSGRAYARMGATRRPVRWLGAVGSGGVRARELPRPSGRGPHAAYARGCGRHPAPVGRRRRVSSRRASPASSWGNAAPSGKCRPRTRVRHPSRARGTASHGAPRAWGVTHWPRPDGRPGIGAPRTQRQRFTPCARR